jgi:tetratricopeptide (TPR) repeat protein
MWRTGANSITKISFSEDVTVEGANVKKGDYGILTKPSTSSWLVNLYKYDGGNWSSYIQKTPDASFSVMPKTSNFNVETFTIDVNNIETSKATINLMWEKTIVPINFSVEVDKQVMANIEKVMAGPSTNDYYNAASYYHDSGKDLEQALEWVRKSTKVASPKFWQVRKEALILADLGRYKEAIEAAKLSKELAVAADNQEYVKMNEKSISEWMKK